MSQVTQAQYNAGNILINIRAMELSKIQKNLQRLRSFGDKLDRKSGTTVPYTEEDICTLLTYKLMAIMDGNPVRVLFWFTATNKVIADVLWGIKMEKIYQHQGHRIGRLADRYAKRAEEIRLEVAAIRKRIGQQSY